MLESLEQSNIKRMSVEEPEKAPKLDVAEMLTDQDWQAMVESAQNRTAQDHLMQMYYLKLISPEKFQAIDKSTLESEQGTVLGLIDRLGTDSTHSGSEMLDLAAAYKSLFPQGLDPAMYRKLELFGKRDLVYRIDHINTGWSGLQIIDILHNLKVLGITFDLNPSQKEKLFGYAQKNLESFRANLNILDTLSLRDFMSRLGQFRIVFPDEKTIHPSETDMKKIQGALQTSHKYSVSDHNFFIFTEILGQTRLALADQIVIDEEGIHAVYRKKQDLDEKKTIMPEQRNF